MTGSGTALDPYVIYTPADFNNIRLDPTAYYVLNNSIDCTGVPMNGFAPFANSFRGSLDGQNFTVSNLVLTDGYFIEWTRLTAVIKNLNITNLTVPAGLQYAGFIWIVDDNSEVTNVHVNVNFNVTLPSGDAGALAITVEGDAHVSNCSSSGSITVASHSHAGGLFSDVLEQAIIEDAFSTVTVTSTAVGGLLHSVLGGFIGSTDADIQISRCYATGAVTSLFAAGQDELGGFMGFTSDNEQISYCYATGNVTGGIFTGGFVAFASGQYEQYKRCYSTGNVVINIPGAAIAGGFAGFFSGTRTQIIYRCYSTGNVTVTSPANINSIGGFIGGYYAGVCSLSYSTGDVMLISAGNGNRLGGFCGEFIGYDNDYPTTIKNCYSRGDVTYAVAGLNYLAGFSGFTALYRVNYIGNIENCYSTGLVTAGVGADVSGFANRNPTVIGGSPVYPVVTGCYWDTTTSGQPASDYGVGEITANMKIQGTFLNWDFVYVWVINPAVNDGYPSFRGITGVTASVSNITSNTATFTGQVVHNF